MHLLGKVIQNVVKPKRLIFDIKLLFFFQLIEGLYFFEQSLFFSAVKFVHIVEIFEILIQLGKSFLTVFLDFFLLFIKESIAVSFLLVFDDKALDRGFELFSHLKHNVRTV